MQAFYKKTQTGWMIVLIFIPVILFFASVIYYQEMLGRPFGQTPAPSWLFLAFLAFFLLLLGLFGTLTVTGFADHLQIKFGIGLIRKRFYYKDMRDCSVKKNPFYFGWGIRAIPGGWLYNVSGVWSGQLDMKNDKMYRIGTPEPERLEQFIKTRISLFGAS